MSFRLDLTVDSSAQLPLDVTLLLREWSEGDTAALDRLIPLVYAQLQHIAHLELRGKSANKTLQPTALVHEFFLRFLNRRSMNWESRDHFFRTASMIMRRILVDHFRRRDAGKRGGGLQRVELPEVIDPGGSISEDVLAVDQALSELERTDKELANLVELRYFGGLSIKETADVLDISEATVKRHWLLAKAFLYRRLPGTNRDE